MRVLIALVIGTLLTGCSTSSEYKHYKNDRNLIKQKSNMEYVLRSYRI